MCVLSIKLINGELEEYMLHEYYYLRYSELKNTSYFLNFSYFEHVIVSVILYNNLF